MFPRNLQLFQRGVTLKLDKLHTVEQRLRDCIETVGSADKQHVGEVIGNVHVVVSKGVILLRVQHLQQCAGRAAVEGCGEFVNFIEHHNRIGHTAFMDAVHNAAGHRTDVGTAMAADIRFIMNTSETDTHILTAERTGNAFADARLARSRCSDKEKDGA